MNNYWNTKNVLITGGSSGLGKALALQLNKLGGRVAIVARRPELLQEVKQQAEGIVTIQGDVSRKETIHSIAAEVHSQLGPIDHLFNVASALGPTPLRLLADTDCEDLEDVLATNLMGPFRLSKLMLPDMILRGSGVVVNISSDAAVSAYPRWGGYGVSKAALDHLSRIFQEELRESGVRFYAIDPGDMKTPMHFAAVPDANADELRDPEDSAREIIEKIAKDSMENNQDREVRGAL